MSSTFLRRGAVLVAVAALALAGCSDDGGSSPTGQPTPSADGPTTPGEPDGATTSPLPDVEATFDTVATSCTPTADEGSALAAAMTLGGALGTAPTVTIDPSYSVPEKGEVAVLCTGDGPVVDEGSVTTYLSRVVTVADGSQLYVTTTPGMITAAAGTIEQGALAGLTVGTRFAMAMPNDGTPAVQVIELVDVLPTAEFVTDAKVGDAGLPTVSAPRGTKPTVTMPEGGITTSARGATRVVLEEGDGDVVTTADTIKAFYLGVDAADGTEFDSSWSRGTEPTEFPLSGVIAGWTHGLAGLKVGSTVLLVIPPALGYGADPSHDLATRTLVFVVTIDSVVDAK